MTQIIQQLDHRLIRQLCRELTGDELDDLTTLLKITDRTLYNWLNQAEMIPYGKLRQMATYFSAKQGVEFSIPDLLKPANLFNLPVLKGNTPRPNRSGR